MLYSSQSKRILWVDWIKALAVVAVAVIHVSTTYISGYGRLSPNWLVGLGFDSFVRFGVVFFIMISGFLILRKPESYKNTPRRFKRVFVPFAFWLLVLTAFYYFIQHHNSDVMGYLGYFLYGLIDPTSVLQMLWFVYMILGVYILAPLISKWILNSEMAEIEYFLAVWAVAISLYFVFAFMKIDSPIYDYLRLFAGPVGYFILGYYLAFKKSKYLESRKFGLILFLLGGLMTFFGTVLEPSYVPDYIFKSVGDVSPNACLEAVGLFIIVKNTDFKKLPDWINSIAVLWSLESYGFYLIHMMVIDIIFSNHLLPFEGNGLIAIPAVTVILLIVVPGFIYLLNKVPILNNFTGVKSVL